MLYSYDETKASIENDKGIVKESFWGHYGFAILWFDKKGYSVTTITRNSHGTSGILSWEDAKKEFILRVTEIINYD